MNLLWLGPEREYLISWLTERGHKVTRTETPLDARSFQFSDVDWLISYGYRHILKPDLLALFPGRAINLHIALLPWNRGADPNLWSFLENTPKGVTIHRLDAGVDTGEILVQKEIFFTARSETLATSYQILSQTIEELFCETWNQISTGKMQSYRQPVGGTFHKARDKEKFDLLLSQGWNTPIENLVGKALQSFASGSPSEGYDYAASERSARNPHFESADRP